MLDYVRAFDTIKDAYSGFRSFENSHDFIVGPDGVCETF